MQNNMCSAIALKQFLADRKIYKKSGDIPGYIPCER